MIKLINESTPKTLLYMKMSEKFKIEKEGEGAISRLGSECPGTFKRLNREADGWPAGVAIATLRKDFAR